MNRYFMLVFCVAIPLAVLIQMVSEWFGFRSHGILNWSLNVGLLLLAAYFTKDAKTNER